jgi:hypothetical protein
MGRYPRERIEARLHLFAIDGAHRVFGVSRMPLQLHSAPSRFYDGRSGFAVMYASMSFETCIVETLVRDRFTHRLKRELPLAAVLARGYARLSTQPDQEPEERCGVEQGLGRTARPDEEGCQKTKREAPRASPP